MTPRAAPLPASAPAPSDSCSSCGSSHLTRDEVRGELVCADCGLVLDASTLVSDRGPGLGRDSTGREARGYGPVISPLFADRGLSSDISPSHRDSQGSPLARDTSVRFYRLRKLNRRVPAGRTHARNLGVALSELQRITSVLGLSREVRESAVMIYRRALDHRATRGKKIVALVAASIYAACRQCHVPRTLKEVITVSRASKLEVARAYSLLARELRLALPPVAPQDFLVRYTQELDLSREVRQTVLLHLARVEKEFATSGVLPNGVLATIIYIACQQSGERRSQDRIAAVANVTPVTIRNHYKEFLDILGIRKECLALTAASMEGGPVASGPSSVSAFGTSH